jgi:hypothetical protein
MIPVVVEYYIWPRRAEAIRMDDGGKGDESSELIHKYSSNLATMP